MPKYQVSYNGKDWELVEDERRMRRILANHFADVAYPIAELERGHQVRTTFAIYRMVK